MITIKTSKVINSAIERLSQQKQRVNITIFDLNHSLQKLYSSPYNENTKSSADINISLQMKVYSRTYLINSVATKLFKDKYITFTPWLILSILISFFAILSFTYFLIARRQFTLLETNEELRRFQKVAIGREERILELKQALSKCQSLKKPFYKK